jgi:hypothetical protein
VINNARVITTMIIPIRNSFVPIVLFGGFQGLVALIARRKTIPYTVAITLGTAARRRLSDRRDGDEPAQRLARLFADLLDDFLRVHPDPIFAMSIELGRYFYARAEIAKAADAAALVAAAEIRQRVFEKTGYLRPTSKPWANAQAFASMNNS